MRLWTHLGRAGASLSVTLALLALPGTSPLPDAAPAMRSAVDEVPLSTARPHPTAGAGRPVSVRRTPVPHRVLALGDSVPEGAACGCTPFPTVYGALLSHVTHAPVYVTDLAQDGQETSGLLAQLAQPATRAAVRAADIIVVTIGANDVEDQSDTIMSGGCARSCVSDELSTMSTRLRMILTRIRELRAGAATTVLVTGYWDVFREGREARLDYGAHGLRTAMTVTTEANAAIAAASRAAGAHYVDLFGPFQRHRAGIESLLAPDGDHPDAAGHQLIAQTLLAAGLPRLA